MLSWGNHPTVRAGIEEKFYSTLPTGLWLKCNKGILKNCQRVFKEGEDFVIGLSINVTTEDSWSTLWLGFQNNLFVSLWWAHDGGPCHPLIAVREQLNEVFGNRVINFTTASSLTQFYPNRHFLVGLPKSFDNFTRKLTNSLTKNCWCM